MRADFLTKSSQQKLSDIGPKGSKKVKNCTKLVHFFTRDGRLRSKWTLFTLFGHYFKNTHSRHYVPLTHFSMHFYYSLFTFRIYSFNMTTCIVPGCKSNYHTQSEFTSVFSFPNDVTMREKWFRAIPRPREDYETNKHLKVILFIL